MKKVLSFLLVAILMTSAFTACSAPEKPAVAEEEGIQVVTTIFPAYDWVMNVLGDNPSGTEVTMLLDNGVDLHSYQPTAEDILKISTCDLFVYVGGESDAWVDDALKGAVNENMIVVNLLDVLGDAAKEEEIVPGMQAEEEEIVPGMQAEEEDEEEEGEAEGESEEGSEYDEHVWLSLRNAKIFVDSIAGALGTVDAGQAEIYKANAAAYKEKLNALDAEYQAAVDEAGVDTLLFGDRFPFRYMTDDYNLNYYAAFAGCSAETEASFETITFLAQKVDELSLHAVMTIEGTDHKIAETIVQSTAGKDQQILALDSIQSVTSADVQNGTSYLSIMEENLSVLKEAIK